MRAQGKRLNPLPVPQKSQRCAADTGEQRLWGIKGAAIQTNAYAALQRVLCQAVFDILQRTARFAVGIVHATANQRQQGTAICLLVSEKRAILGPPVQAASPARAGLGQVSLQQRPRALKFGEAPGMGPHPFLIVHAKAHHGDTGGRNQAEDEQCQHHFNEGESLHRITRKTTTSLAVLLLCGGDTVTVTRKISLSAARVTRRVQRHASPPAISTPLTDPMEGGMVLVMASMARLSATMLANIRARNAAAVRAVLMAQAGFTASPDAIDGKFGYLALYASGEDVSSALSALGAAPLEIDAMGIDIKKYPCCYAIHRPLDGILALRKAHALTPANVTKIAITNSAGGLDALLPQPPVNGLQANFNMAYCLSAALRDGAIRLASFDDAQVMRPEIRALLPKVSLQEAPGAILPRWSHVRLELADGQVLEQRVNSARGDAGDPLSDAELIEKVADCFACGGLDADAGVFARRVFELSKWRVDDVILALHASR